MAFSVFIVKPGEKQEGAKEKGTLSFERVPSQNGWNPLSSYNIHCSKTFGPFFNFKGHMLALGEGLEACSADGGMMNEHVRSVISLNETETFPVVEPLHCSLCHSANLLSQIL